MNNQPKLWKPGDTCFIITNKRKGYTTEYRVLHQNGDYYFCERITGGSRINASPNRMFETRADALASLDSDGRL